MTKEAKSIKAAGGYGNMVLYRMCADQPLHVDRGIVESKARTIAKVYEVSRNLGSDYELIAKVLCSHKLAIDAALAKLEHSKFSQKTLPHVVQIHTILDHALCEQLRKKVSKLQVHSRASFVSKYLHFHLPSLFPILDSVAEHDVKRRIGRLPEAQFNDLKENQRYERFCRAILLLRCAAAFEGKSLRAIDDILLGKRINSD